MLAVDGAPISHVQRRSDSNMPPVSHSIPLWFGDHRSCDRASDTVRRALAAAILAKRAARELLEGDAQLVLGVHHDGTVPGDGLAERLARDAQQPHALRLGRDGDLVAVTKDHQVTVPDQAVAGHVAVVPAHGVITAGILLLAEHP